MKGGFTFCGQDIADYGLEYAPENENTYVYAPAESELHSEIFEGHNGGYIYGAYKKPKEFILRCFFEEKQIDRGIMTRVYNLFRVGKSGKLVFKRKPWCYYYATVTSNPSAEFTNYLNGLITITMQASYPFARGESMSLDTETEEEKKLHAFYNLPTDPCHDDIMLNTGLFDKAEMVPPLNYENLTEATSILLANPGTERAHLGITAMGDAGSGVTIANSATGQKCRIVAMSKAVTTEVNKEVFIDGINGKTILRGTGDSHIAFLYHDEGFIELEPSFPVIRNVFISYTGGTNINFTNNIEENVVGKFIFAANKWRKIVAQSGRSLTVRGSDSLESSGSEQTIISSMNELYISPVSTMNLDRIGFVYKPTFA